MENKIINTKEITGIKCYHKPELVDFNEFCVTQANCNTGSGNKTCNTGNGTSTCGVGNAATGGG